MRTVVASIFLLALSGCGFTPFLYKTDVVQGNVFSDDQLARIHPGQSRAEVERILGTPQLSDPFHRNRADYLYDYFSGESRTTYRRGITIYYNSADLVERVETTPLTIKQSSLFSGETQ